MYPQQVIYLNNAASGFPKPALALQALEQYCQQPPGQSHRPSHPLQNDPITSCRQKLADLFHAPDPEQIVFTASATEALNLAILGSPLKKNQIITTNTEHNSVLRPLKKKETTGEYHLVVVDCDNRGFVSPAEIIAKMGEQTGAVVVNHCSNVTGRVLPLKFLAAAAHAVGALFIVDASQSAGLYDIDVETDDIDMLAFTGHKFLYGLPGVGGLYIKKGLWPTPLKVGGTGTRSDSPHQPQVMPLYYEAGTPNTPGIATLAAGLDFINHTGINTIRQRIEALVNLFLHQLQEVPGLHFYGRQPGESNGTLICLNIQGLDSQDLGFILEHSFRIITRSGLFCAPLIHRSLGTYPHGAVRFSPSYFTSEAEIRQTTAAIRQIATSLPGTPQ